MSNASDLQTSFLGGEFAPSMQGRADLPKYKTGLALCRNSMPLETGAWQRRPGTRFAAFTRGGVFGRIIDFDFTQSQPFTMELTDSHIRFFNGYQLVHTDDAEVIQDISTATPAVVTTLGASAFSNGDSIDIVVSSPSAPANGSQFALRQFLLQSVSGDTFALYDPNTGGAIDGSTLDYVSGTPTMAKRILDLASPFRSGMLQAVRAITAINVVNENVLILLHNLVTPQVISAPGMIGGAFNQTECSDVQTFGISTAAFQDGPYLDPPKIGTTITPSDVGPGTGITLTASAATFAATDIGRFIRLFSQPANWSVGTTYGEGELVTYQDAYYTALVANTGNVPGTDVVNWGVATNAAAWVWATITAFTDAEHVTVTFNTTAALPGVLVNTLPITDDNYQLGLFSQTSAQPACGTYHEGRLWLSGAINNRIDGSVSNDIFNFSPSAVDGTVSDNNAIDYTFNFADANAVEWMTPQQTGIVCGTQAGEVLVQASTAGDVLTPTSIQAKRVTRYGDANVEPINAPFATLFVERNNKKVLEYLADVFTGKYSAINVSLSGSHLLEPGVEEIRYQKELCPVAWVRMTDGSFAGMTYRRESPMLSEQPAFAGWHSHELGTDRQVISIAVGPNVSGNLDTLSMVTFDPTDYFYRVEVLNDMFPDNGTNQDAWYLDGAIVPSGATMTPTNLTIYGLEPLNGQTVSAYLAGVDVGDFAVSSGSISITLPAANGLLTYTGLQELNNPELGAPFALDISFATGAAPSTPAIQIFIPESPITVGSTPDNMIVDATNNRLFTFSAGDTSGCGIATFDMNSGDMTSAATLDEIYGLNTPATIGGLWGFDYQGHIVTIKYVSNSATYVVIDADDMKILGTAGIAGSSLTPELNNMMVTQNLAPASVCGVHLVMGISEDSTPHCVVGLITTDGYVSNAGISFQITEETGYSTPTAPGLGVIYHLGIATPGSPSTAALGLYKSTIVEAASEFNINSYPTIQNASIFTERVGSLLPNAVDATWSHFGTLSAMAYDQSDGNLMFFASTTDSVTNTSYLVKVNSQSFAVIWATPTPSPADGFVMANSWIAYNRFSYLSDSGGTAYLNAFDTSTGSVVQTQLFGFGSITSSMWDERFGGVFAFGDFTATGGSPTQLNDTPAAFTSEWFRLTDIATGSPTPWNQLTTVPAVVGYTYTSQGQRLRPLAPQDTGSRIGPALGLTRRNHRFAALLLNTTAISFGTTFDKLHAALFKSPGGQTTYAANQLYSGVWSNPLEDNNSYDGMFCWQITRPYPATVLASQTMIDTQER